jgi:hypothetical protein
MDPDAAELLLLETRARLRRARFGFAVAVVGALMAAYGAWLVCSA